MPLGINELEILSEPVEEDITKLSTAKRYIAAWRIRRSVFGNVMMLWSKQRKNCRIPPLPDGLTFDFNAQSWITDWLRSWSNTSEITLNAS